MEWEAAEVLQESAWRVFSLAAAGVAVVVVVERDIRWR
jgi:hypothetical protein